jgi:3-hydroxyacyl-CoA dehydrogenase/enoyl-CoA hydratase/3-hydroxybutyryl-CoA epimerase
MNHYRHLSLTRDENDLLWLELDVAGKSTNVLSVDVLEEIDQVCDEIKAEKARGLVIHSGKSTGFVAGADIAHFQKVENKQQALEFIEKGQQIFRKYEDLPLPTLVIIQGFCLGGGLEWALACDYRIASNAPAAKIGLPEVRLGIHPGFGGSVRAVRQMGVLAAMNMILSGRSLGGYQAKRMGLVDESLPDRQLINAARQILLDPPRKKSLPWHLRILESAPLRPVVASMLRRQVAKKVNPKHYPAPFAQIEVWRKFGSHDAAMYQAEAESVASLIIGDTAQNLVRVFFLQDRLKSLGDKSLLQPRHVHVIGAGVMGADIAAWCAMQNLRVTLQDKSDEALAKAVSRASGHFGKRYKRDRFAWQQAVDRLIPDRAGDGIARADVIIEAVFENRSVKQEIFKALEEKAKPEAILASNTSSIPLQEIAAPMQVPQRLVGLHFFNPVIKMPLLEIVFDSEQTDRSVTARAQAFARHINKLPLPVRSEPGFLVNRILMPYLMEAVKCYQQGIPAQVIDKAATDYGMPMGPLQLADTVGLDICLHVGKILADELGMTLPDNLEVMIEKGWLGRKSGQGFYRYKEGKPVAREKAEWQGDRDVLQQRLINKLVEESQRCLEEGIVEDADLLDAGLIFGTGFAPFRGGLKLGNVDPA